MVGAILRICSAADVGCLLFTSNIMLMIDVPCNKSNCT